MQSRTLYLIFLFFVSAFMLQPVSAKHNVQATVHTAIPVDADQGSRIEISWTLANIDTGKPFSANAVFVRLIGSSGSKTEAFTKSADGQYKVVAIVPDGGISAIEIGVAGTSTNPTTGQVTRSDWIMPLANDPLQR